MSTQNERLTTMAQAIREATEQAMAADPTIFVLGEGVTDPKAIFGTTDGLLKRFGDSRVIEMPVAENGLTGIAIGAALTGRRPLLIHQRVEFALLSMEQLVNNAAKMRYVSNGRHAVPFVVRMVVGRGWGQGPAHSQSLEPLFAYVPGLKVVMPSMAGDAKGMLLTALRENDPVIFLEHRWCHYATGHVPVEPEPTPIDGPRCLRAGTDVTIVASSYMVYEALLAADVAARFDISCEVFDLRVLRPLKLDQIVQAVGRTGRLAVVDTGFRQYGIGAEIASTVVEQAFARLKAPPVRIGLPDRPTPSSRALAAGYYPTAETIISRLAATLGIDAGKTASMIAEVRRMKPDIEADVPNPMFKGPF